MHIRGITKLRDEGRIIQATLDNWASFCDAIHVYCDVCTDDTAEICRSHPAVVEVIESDLEDPNRERAEWFNRQQVLNSVRRFLQPDDWIFYADGDEHIHNLTRERLTELDKAQLVAVRLFDAHITEEDQDWPEERYADRQWVGPEWALTPVLYRARLPWQWRSPDQRVLYCGKRVPITIAGTMIHYGKALSVERFERKCQYYAEVFGPKYAAKWHARRGKAVHTQSDFGHPLVRKEDVLQGSVEVMERSRMPLVA